METISGAVDFSKLKISFHQITETQKLTCYKDKNAVLYTEDTDESSVFFKNGDTVCIYTQNASIVYTPQSIIFKTTKARLYYTFLGSCLVFSTDRHLLKNFDSDEKNTVSIPTDSYGKFSKDGLSIY